MKKYLLFLFFIFPTVCFATKMAKFPTAMEKIEAFSEKKLDPKKDLGAVKKILLTLLALDDKDPSRTAVMTLSKSYTENQELYDKAFKAIETKKNKKQLKEIQEIMDHHYEDGNG